MIDKKITSAELQELEEMAATGLATFAEKGDSAHIEKVLNKRISARAPVRKLNRRWLSVAAAIALIFGVFTIWKSTQSVPASMYQSYYEAPPFVLSEASRGGATAGFDLSTIRSAYLDQDYKALLNLSSGSEAPAGLSLYEGIALLETGQLPLAIEKLKSLQDPELLDMQQWYLAMAHLAADQTDLAKDLLGEISEASQHYKSKEAVEILTEME